MKLADVPAWIARRDKTPMGIYQGGIRSKFNKYERRNKNSQCVLFQLSGNFIELIWIIKNQILSGIHKYSLLLHCLILSSMLYLIEVSHSTEKY